MSLERIIIEKQARVIKLLEDINKEQTKIIDNLESIIEKINKYTTLSTLDLINPNMLHSFSNINHGGKYLADNISSNISFVTFKNNEEE